VQLIDGRGNPLRFGGRVIKNVAGYDVSRLMVGALGTLGILLEISLRALPIKPELTLQLELDEARAIERMNLWALQGLPLSATCHHAGRLSVRFAGVGEVLERVRKQLGGEELRDGAQFWCSIRDQTNAFFTSASVLWRVSVPPTTGPLNIAADHMIEWGGALRWLSGDLDANALRAQIEARGGSATLFRGVRPATVPAFHPLEPRLLELHRRLKDVFDPHRILNSQRMYAL
jgi:glycolate oxidase FAD binding subunit